MSDAVRYRASPAQADVWLADTLAGDNPPSTVRLAVHAPVVLSAATVAAAARRLADRHAILSSRLTFDEGGLWVRPESFTVAVDDLRGTQSDPPGARTRLGTGVPWHVWLCDPEPTGTGCTVVLAFDHAYVDGESIWLLLRDFIDDCRRMDAGLALPPVVSSPDYRHYAESMLRAEQHPDQESSSFWKTFRLESTHWRTSDTKPRPAWPTQRAHIDSAALARVKQWAGATGVTLFGAVLAASAHVILDRVSGPVVIAVPVSQRADPRFAHTVGLCTELCPLSVDMRPSPFADFARELFLDLLQAVEHLLPLAAVRRLRTSADGAVRGQRLDSITVTMIDELSGAADWPVCSSDDDNAGRDLAIVVVRGTDGLTVVARTGHAVFGETPIAHRIASLLETL